MVQPATLVRIPSNTIAPTWDNRFRKTSHHLFSLKLIYKIHITGVNIWIHTPKFIYIYIYIDKMQITKVYISKFTSVNPIYQNSYNWTLYIYTMHIIYIQYITLKCISLKSIYHIYVYVYIQSIKIHIYITQVNVFCKFIYIKIHITIVCIYQNSHHKLTHDLAH
jgi:hypothetical protein